MLIGPALKLLREQLSFSEGTHRSLTLLLPLNNNNNNNNLTTFQISGAPFKVAKVDVVGTFAHISRPFKVIPDDACGNYGFDCPVGVNEDKTLKLTLPVKKFYPSGLQVQVVFKLLDENTRNIFCITFPAKIITR